MPDSVDDEIFAGLKTPECEDVATKSNRIMFDAHLAEVLQRLAISWIAAKPFDFMA